MNVKDRCNMHYDARLFILQKFLGATTNILKYMACIHGILHHLTKKAKETETETGNPTTINYRGR